MHIETLKIFCDLVELESFSKTAEKHLLSQSAVSQQLAQLELVHKVQLLDRKKDLRHRQQRDSCFMTPARTSLEGMSNSKEN